MDNELHDDLYTFELSRIAEMEERMLIDKFNLDDELMEHAEIFYNIGKMHVEAVSVVDQLKSDHAKTHAELDIKYRGKHYDKKPTESQLSALITIDAISVESEKACLAAKLVADKLRVLKDAFDKRGYMLRDLTGLYTTEYYFSDASKGNVNNGEAKYKLNKDRMKEARNARSKERTA